MLSSLGACRDQSPVKDQPPSKIFVQYQETEEESQKPSFQPASPSGAPGQTEPQPAVRAKVPEQSQILSEVSSQAVDLKTQQCSQPVPMIVVQEYEEVKSSPQPQIHLSVQVKTSQSIEVKSEKVVSAQTKIDIEHHVESQESLPLSVSQQQTEKGPVASQPSQNLQQAESQVHNTQQLATQPHVYIINQQEKTQLTKQEKVQPQVSIQSQSQGQLETQTQHAPKQQRKVKKSQAHLQNRPWLQQSQLENFNQKTMPQLIPKSQSEPEDKCKIISQAPPQHIVAVSSPEARGAAQGTAQSKSIVEGDEKHLKPAQSVAQERPLVETQNLPQTVPAVLAQPVTQKQPQQPVTVSIHQQVFPQPQPFLATQAQTTTQQTQAIAPNKQPQTQIMTPQQPQVMIQKQVQSQSMTPMQPQVMAQWQPQQTIAQPHPTVPRPHRFPVAQTMPQRLVQQYQTSPIQPQITMHRHQSLSQQPTMRNPTVISPQPKGASPIQPRIISMPQPQMPVQSQNQSQVKAQGTAIQLQGQLQWGQLGDLTQTYPRVQGPISVPARMQPLAHFQTHPQPQSVPPTQPQQWSPIRPGIVTQIYPTVQIPGQIVQPQITGYPKIQPQSQPQQWPSARPESLLGQSQIRTQCPAQHIVPSQQWRPVSPERVSPVYPRPEAQGPKGPHPQSQYQALPRPASPQCQWSPVQPEHQFQVSSQTMFLGAPQPVASWNQPPAQAPIRPPSQQQPQQSQQKWSSSRTEAPSATLIQSQVAQAELQSQDLTNPQLPIQEPPQQQSAPRVKQPVLAQAPPQAYTEAYIKAQALVRDRFEEAKHCLQEHIIEAINVFKYKRMTDLQASFKEVCPF